METIKIKWKFLELAKKILEEEKKPLSSEEIWEVAKSKGYDKHVGTQGKTPWATIGAQIYVNIRDNKDSPFIKIDSRPKRFYLHSLMKCIVPNVLALYRSIFFLYSSLNI